jgi:hypothetical protein
MTFRPAGHDKHAKVTRPWQAIAEEVTRETDPEKLTELVAELNRALDEQKLSGKDGNKGKPPSPETPPEHRTNLHGEPRSGVD